MSIQTTPASILSRMFGAALLTAISSIELYAQPNATASSSAPANAQAAPAGNRGGDTKPSPEQAAVADWIEEAFAGSDMPESVRMLVAIARGSQMGPGEGWFGPSQTRYDWEWLAGVNGSENYESY